MFAFSSSSPSKTSVPHRKFTANILPASIKHTGPIPFASRYWNPVDDDDDDDDDDVCNIASDKSVNEPAKRQDAFPQCEGVAIEASRDNDESPAAKRRRLGAEPATSKTISTSTTAYFRGRRLRGHNIALPPGYEGVILSKTDRVLTLLGPSRAEELRKMEERRLGYGDDDEDVEEDDDDVMGSSRQVDVRIMEELGRFDEVVVFGHEALPDEAEDVHVRGLREWIGFAEAVSSTFRVSFFGGNGFGS